MSGLVSRKATVLFFTPLIASAAMLTCRRHLADKPQTVTQTKPQTLACQEGRRAIHLDEVK